MTNTEPKTVTEKTGVGNITSSGIVALIPCSKRPMTPEELAARPKKGTGSATTQTDNINTFSQAGLTYIYECKLERRLGLPLEMEMYSKETSWGNVGEKYLMNDHKLMSADYIQRPDESIFHPKYPYWCGRPDARKVDTIGDVKCPWTRKSFCELVAPLYPEVNRHPMNGMDAVEMIRETVKDGEKYYWQIVSNACICEAAFGKEIKYGELIIFMPYFHQLTEIRNLAGGYEEFKYIATMGERYLPYIKEGGYYTNKNVIRFEIPQADKDFLTHRVELAGKILGV